MPLTAENKSENSYEIFESLGFYSAYFYTFRQIESQNIENIEINEKA
jgi:hypothetical protein